MPDIEAIGDAVTGAALSRAVEPDTGDSGYTHETACLNCGAELDGPYCSMCGQHAHVHRTLSAFFHDLLHGVLHFEGKVWHTLPLLALKPGDLTRRYIDGQRARFVSPIALFLFCVFLTFATLSLTGSLTHDPEQAKKAIASELSKDKRKLAGLEEARAGLVKSRLSTANVDAKIADLRDEIGGLTAVSTRDLPIDTFDFQGGGTVRDGVVAAIGKAKENPELMFYKIKMNAYKFGWALIPISVPFVWLLFPFSRRFRMYDHTVFVTYSLCFMMLLLVATTLVGLASESIASVAWFLPPVHMYKQLRGTYAIGRWPAIWRTFALTGFAFIAIGLFVSFLVTLGTFE